MTGADAERAAALLIEARREHRAMLLPDECRPRNLEEAYAIQDRVTAGLGLALAGWKIGATAGEVARAEGAASPVSGRLFTPHVHHGPAHLEAARFTSFRNCEVEFVMRLDDTLAPRGDGHGRAAVAAAVGAVIPAIEIGDSRLADRATAGIVAVCADNSGGTELVLGTPIEGWRDLDLPARSVTLRIDGEPVATGSGADVMGDPIEALVWLTGHLGARGLPMPAGTLVATGSCTGINFAAAGTEAVAGFGELGEVRVTFG